MSSIGNLMNHTNIVNNLAGQVERRKKLAYLGHPYVLGELNSIAGEGITGVTNVFGSALWLVDFSLWAGQHVMFSQSFMLLKTTLTFYYTGNPASSLPPRNRLPICFVAAY
jgi:hypothetical protein